MNEDKSQQLSSMQTAFRSTKDSLLIDIPSIILNNLVDENGDIRSDCEIPDDLLQLYEQRMPKTNKQSKLKKMTTSISNYQSIPIQGKNNKKSQRQSSLPRESSNFVGLTEQTIKTILQCSSLYPVKELTLVGPKCPFIFNKIESPLVNLPNLTLLEISFHQIEKIENLSFLTQLTQLSLRGNQIRVIERLESLKNLEVLDLSQNLIEKIPFQIFSRLVALKQLDLSNNKIADSYEIKSLINNKEINQLNLKDNEITQNEDYLLMIEQNLPQLIVLDEKPFQNMIKGCGNPKPTHKKRAKSEGKIQTCQSKVSKLNLNLERQVFDQKKVICKKNEELTNALEYVNDLEEELLNIKINALFSQSALCSPRGESQNQSNFIEGLKPLISPQYSNKNIFDMGKIGSNIQTSLSNSFPCMGNQNQINSLNNLNNTKVDNILLSPVTNTIPQNTSCENIQKNLNNVFSQIRDAQISPNNQQKTTQFESLFNAQEQKQRLITESEQLLNKKELLKTRLYAKQENIKSLDYEIKSLLVKLMDLNTKINHQSDTMTSLNFGEIQNIINERVQFVKKFILMKIQILKQKSNTTQINEQLQFIQLQQYYLNNGDINTSINQYMISLNNKIAQNLKLKRQKVEATIHDNESKLKLLQEYSKQELLDQSIYEFYQKLETANTNKQLLKQNEYDLQKWIKKFNKNEKLFDTKLKKLDTLLSEQISLIKDVRDLEKQLVEKEQAMQAACQRELLNQINDHQIKATDLGKKIKCLENDKKKLTQRLVVKRNDSLFSKTEKQELESLLKKIDDIENTQKQLDPPKEFTLKRANNSKRSLSPANESYGTQLITGCQRLISIVETLHQQLEKKDIAFQNQYPNKELEAYLCSTSMIQSPGKNEQFLPGTNASIMRTLDNNTFNNQLQVSQSQQFQPQQLNTHSQQQQQVNQMQQAELEYFKQQLSQLKQQMLEIEQERDQIQIELINKKEYHEQILKGIREQISEKESRYTLLLKEMQQNIQDLSKKNNEMIKINSDLIQKVCCSESSESGQNQISCITSKVKRLEWFLSTQSKLIESLIKEKSQLEQKCSQLVSKQQLEIERLPTHGTSDFQTFNRKQLNTLEQKSQDSFQEKNFTSYDYQQIQKTLSGTQPKPIFSRQQKSNNITELTQNTENNMIQQLFNAFQQQFISQQQQEESFKQQQMSYGQASSSCNDSINTKIISMKQRSIESSKILKKSTSVNTNSAVTSKQPSANTTRESAKNFFTNPNSRAGLDMPKIPLQEVKNSYYRISNPIMTDRQYDTSDFAPLSMFEGADSDLIDTGHQSLQQEYSFNRSNCNLPFRPSNYNSGSNPNLWTAGQQNQENIQSLQTQQTFGKFKKQNSQSSLTNTTYGTNGTNQSKPPISNDSKNVKSISNIIRTYRQHK